MKELRRNREFGIERVVLVRRGVIRVTIDAFLVLLPSLRLLTTVSVGARVLLLVTGGFLLSLVVTPAGGRVVVLYRLGSGWLGWGRPLVDKRLETRGSVPCGPRPIPCEFQTPESWSAPDPSWGVWRGSWAGCGGRGVELRSRVSEREVRGRGSRWRMCGAKGFLSSARKRVLTRSGSLSG